MFSIVRTMPIPALFTRIVMGPSSLWTCSTILDTLEAKATSPLIGTARRPIPRI
jgi:hypothetical protein